MHRAPVILALSLLAVTTVPAVTGDLGSIEFPNSGAPAAQEAFRKAVLLLHNFEYEDARELFQEAGRIDPDFAMAAWGEAMTHNHPIWREQDREAGLAALAKCAPTPEARLGKAPTERERDYLRAVEILYGEGEKLERDLAYSEWMAGMARRYPEDLEARAFHALAILGEAQGIRDFATYMRAGAVAEEVFAANPRHPGAAHYMIHSYDDPVHAPLGLRAARVYATIAPAASHAQHMISHIYVALGLWPESVEANVKSFDVSFVRRKEKGLGTDSLNYHSLHWLEYSYLQLGRLEDARKALDMMTGYAGESGSPRALWHHAMMRAGWIVETGREAPEGIRLGETQITAAAADSFAAGYLALLKGDRTGAEKAVELIGSRRETAAAGHLCGQKAGYSDTSKTDLAAAEVMRTSLRALIELDAGRTDGALSLLEEATAAEEGMPMDFGPPAIVKPSHEIYGEVLLKLGRPQEALDQFRKALERAPRRSLSLAGMARAARAVSDTKAVARACAELESIYAGADETVSLPEACAGGAVIGRAAPAGSGSRR